MTIDEAIAFCHEKSNNIKLKAEPQVFIQIAEWLEELKDYQDKNKMVVRIDVENMDSVEDKINDLSKYAESQYNKAIDNFMDILLAERTQCYNFDDSEHNNPIKCVWWNDIEGIAEQLKEGGEDE